MGQRQAQYAVTQARPRQPLGSAPYYLLKLLLFIKLFNHAFFLEFYYYRAVE